MGPGATHDLPAVQLVLGGAGGVPSATAVLDVKPGQSCRLRFKLGTCGYARGEGEPLETGELSFALAAE